jgi:two-component system, OmpR family, sensor kinase
MGRRLSLRSRLVVGVVVLAAIGLVAADIATYTSQRSFLVGQVDDSLDAAHAALVGRFAGPGGPGPGPGDGDASRRTGPARGRLIGTSPGVYVQLRKPDGTVIAHTDAPAFLGGRTRPAPSLPTSIELGGSAGDRAVYLTVPAVSGDDRWRVRASREPALSGNVVVVAASLAEVDDTLHRLLVVELFVTLSVLAALTVLALWVVRVGLRPLTAIGDTAAAIAAGDLSRRVERDDERTEVGRLGRALNAMLTQIETAFRAREASEARLRRFVADASHELRTPLAAVRAYAELFQRGAAQRPADLERSMQGITRESERMSLLVEDLLLLARLDEGRPLERAPVDLRAVVGEAIDAAHVVDPERPLDVDLEDATVSGDRDRLRQMIDNLFANVRAHTPPETPVHVSLVRRGETVELAVADRGPGLDADHAARVFERFYRTDSSRTRSSGGVGLGLAIVAAIAEAHGGSAAVRPTDGGGATFAVTLPLSNDTGGLTGRSEVQQMRFDA